MAYWSPRLVRSGAVPTEYHFVSANAARRLVWRGMSGLRRLMDNGPWICVPLAVLGGGLFLGLSFIGNVDALRASRGASTRGHRSSFVLRLTVDLPPNLEVENDWPTKRDRRDKPVRALTKTDAAAAGNETLEPQYDRWAELKDTIGLTPLGLMTKQIEYDDPRRIGFLIARYKFVAKMLSGCRNAGEVGCGDAFGTRVVLQEVPDLTVYDFDPWFIEDILARQDERWSLKAEVHDIVAAPLPRKHDSLFSLDVIEHIAPENEHAYLANLCDSLSEDGLLIIGTPLLESQPFVSLQSKEGQINCKSGQELKALLEKYFARVFMFSMNDELVQPGFSPMAHYLFAFCAVPKR
jgi:hypothetical protein